ncbi:MAG: hypothetical protein PHZ26_01940 [Candidatus Gracilibacteria bacterium]|nr:hypothetical protein [Candidatus Gracilibacteria bacterium]MDD2908495.1 hypothetical protein [Candidatus Gracilibacteria bacterium]
MKKNPSSSINSINKSLKSKLIKTVKVKEFTKNIAKTILLNEYYKKIELSINQIKELNDILTGNESAKNTEIKLDLLFEDVLFNSSIETQEQFQILKAKNLKKSTNKNYEYMYSGIEKYTIHETEENDEVNKLIIFYNGIIRIKGKLKEMELLKKFPGIIDSDDIEYIFKKKIKGTEYEKIFIDTFGNNYELNELNKKLLEYGNLDSEEIDFENIIEPPSIPNDFEKKCLYRNLSLGLSECESLRLEYDKLSVSIFLDNGDYNKLIKNNSSGSHYPGTVFNVIRESKDTNQMNITLEHEKTHNIYHAFNPGQSIKGIEYFDSSFNRIIRLMQLQAPEVIIQSDFKLLKKKIRNFFLSSQDEIIANFHDLKNGKLATALYQYTDIIKKLKFRKNELLKEKKLSKGNSEILEHINDILNGMSEYFGTFYRRLADLVYISEHEGLQKDLFASLILWTPSKHYKIEKYFRMKIGNTKYDYYCTIRTIIKPDYFITPKKKIVDPCEKLLNTIFGNGNLEHTEKEFVIAKHKDYLSPVRLCEFNNTKNIPSFFDQSNNIYKKIVETEFSDIFIRLKIKGISEFLKYKKILLIFLEKVGINKKELIEIENQLIGEYDFYIFQHKKSAELIKDMLDNLPEKYSDYLNYSIKETYNLRKGHKDKKSIALIKIILNHPRSKGLFK